MELTEEQKKALELKEREEDRYDELKRVHSTILKGLQDLPRRAGERAIWELMQNARDLSKEAVVKITLKENCIEFAHKGEPFTRRTLRSLIMQQSSKSVGDENAGQYGTGFMTTHVFNQKIGIKGSVVCELPQKKLYITLPEGFCLDRSLVGIDEKNFVNEVGKLLDLVDELKNGTLSEEPLEWTTFVYELSEEMQKKVATQVDITTQLMPYVLALNPRIKECTIENELIHSIVKYEKSATPKIELMWYDNNVNLVTYNIKVNENANVRFVEMRMLQTVDKKDTIIIPPLPYGLDDVTKIPSEFLYFPMLGSEDFGVNFIFNSQRLYPTEPRDSYQFPTELGGNSAHLIKVITTNKEVLASMFKMLFDYYRNNPTEQHLTLPFAKVAFKRKFEDSMTEEYFNQLQILFSEEFAKWKMIPTREGHKAINSNDAIRVKVLDPAIYEGLDDEKLAKYIPVISKYAAQIDNILLPCEDIVEWARVVYGWAPDKADYYITLEDICQSIKYNAADLKEFLSFLVELGAKGDELMQRYPLIPNRKGMLCTKLSLRNGKTITKALYDIASPLLGTEANKLVDESFADIIQLIEYTRKDLANEISANVRKMRDTSIVLNNELADDVRSQLIRYCSAYNTQPLENNYRANLMPLICEVFGEKYQLQIIEKVDPEESDLFATAFNVLLENTLLHLSMKTLQSNNWLTTDSHANAHKDLLLRFVKAFTVSKSDDTLAKIDKYSLFPNQQGMLCIKKALKKNLHIDKDLQELYTRMFKKDLKEKFVDDDFADVVDFEEYEPKDICREIDDNLSQNGYKDDEVLFILRKITLDNDSKWKEWFKNIDARKESLYFEHGTDEDKKALFDLQMQGSEKLKRIAKLAKHPNFDSIIRNAEIEIAKQQESQRQFQFTFAIGTLIENVIRQELGEELQVIKPTHVDVDDVQGGQDIIISHNEKPLYRLECKAKWNFSEPAHMSSLQMKRAVEEADAYALCCIDCTDTGCNVQPDATQDEVNAATDDIRAHTYIHSNIGNILNPIIKTLVEHESKDIPAEEDIRVNSTLSCNIPKKVFVKGVPFNTFVEELKRILKQKIQ